MAKLLKEKLNPNLKIYLEYSNEVWNGQFAQHAYAGNIGQTLGYSGEPWGRAWKYTAKRSADVFYIFESVFGSNSTRLVKVVPCWAGNDWVSNEIMSYFNDPLYNPKQVKADALAIAPYFGGAVGDQIGRNNEVGSISTAEIVRRIRTSLPETFAWMDAHKIVADRYKVKLMAYEGGSHIVATWPLVDNSALTEKLIAANRDPELQSLYCEYTNYWYNTTKADLFSFFSSHGLPSKWGSWGMKEYMSHTEAPKYKALQECVFAKTTATRDQHLEPVEVQVFPNPNYDGSFRIQHGLNKPRLVLYDVLGRRTQASVTEINAQEMQVLLPGTAGGVVFGVLQDGRSAATFKVAIER